MTTRKKAPVQEAFKIWQAANPHPETELAYTTPFQLLVAVVLSAQMTDTGVNKATAPLFKTVKAPEDLIALSLEEVETALKSINLFRTKAKNILALAHLLIEKHGSKVPLNREALEALPGVGRKTANVVLGALTDEPQMAVDTHVFRLAHRLGWSRGKTPLDVEKDLMKLIPKPYQKHAHHWLILHGRYICTAKKPKCDTCPLAPTCPKIGLSKTTS
ncbi:MAG: endonuclease III [Alphaproteobacteria bacterium CG_4_10_14_0_8_um_filter_53_9]|nr:MAG: endonuclease III [Alphaproteobacteria bacterium CG_4_10_14_0_8_um_filter_53_9]